MTYYSMDEEPENRCLQNNYITSIVRDAPEIYGLACLVRGLALLWWRRKVRSLVLLRRNWWLAENDVCAIVPGWKAQLLDQYQQRYHAIISRRKSAPTIISSNGVAIQEFLLPLIGAMLPQRDICFKGNNGFATFTPDELQELLTFRHLFYRIVVNKWRGGTWRYYTTLILDDITEEIRLKYTRIIYPLVTVHSITFFRNRINMLFFLKAAISEWNSYRQSC